MNTKSAITAKDLSQTTPASPRQRIGGYVIAARTADKCKAHQAGTIGEYHYDCPLDNMLFSFKGITAKEFTEAVNKAKSYDDLGAWLKNHGSTKTDAEVKAWSDQMEAANPAKSPEKRDWFIGVCKDLGLDAEKTTLFDMLEADDKATVAAV